MGKNVKNIPAEEAKAILAGIRWIALLLCEKKEMMCILHQGSQGCNGDIGGRARD